VPVVVSETSAKEIAYIWGALGECLRVNCLSAPWPGAPRGARGARSRRRSAINNDTISQVNVEDEMRESYLSYAMSVIASRALPDVRDGLKPCSDASFTRCARWASIRTSSIVSAPVSSVKCSELPSPRRFVGLRRARTHGAEFHSALSARRRSRQLRLDRSRLALRPIGIRKRALDRLSLDLLADIDKETVPFRSQLR